MDDERFTVWIREQRLSALETDMVKMKRLLEGGVDDDGTTFPGVVRVVEDIRRLARWAVGGFGAVAVAVGADAIIRWIHH